MITAFSGTLPMYMILRFIIGFASISVVNIGFVLVVELVSGKWVTIVGILAIVPMPVSYVIISGIAYLAQNWRRLQMVISSPWILLICFW